MTEPVGDPKTAGELADLVKQHREYTHVDLRGQVWRLQWIGECDLSEWTLPPALEPHDD